MADNLTTQTATLATIPGSTVLATNDLSSRGHAGVVTFGSRTGTDSRVAAAASSTTVLASNTARLGATLYNDSNSACYVKCGTTASATSFAVRMSPGSFWEVPFSYSAIITAIWDVATGSMQITEFT